MKLVCHQTGRLLERCRSGLSAAEGLRLEEHLATCASCRADANLLEGLSGIAATARVPLSASARERALSNALTATASKPVPRNAPPRRAGILLLGAAAALALGVVFALRGSREDLNATMAAPSVRVLSGQVQVAGSARSAGEALSSHVQLHTTDTAVVALGHARVELRADSIASWDGPTRTLDLQRGSALIDVDPDPRRSFQVKTLAFGVVVLGTRFEVSESAVQVLLGRVSVQPTAAGAAAVVLAAGSDRTRFELPPTAADVASGALAADAQRTRLELPPSAAGAAAAAHAADSKRQAAADARVESARAASQPRAAAASALLERARSELAARELAHARATLELATPLLRDAALRAQALSLEAECELQARRFDVARDTYLRVARRFPKMPAAETALFAAARIEAEHGDRARARELLTSYLAKYSQGSFAREVERRLQQLPEGKPSEPAP